MKLEKSITISVKFSDIHTDALDIVKYTIYLLIAATARTIRKYVAKIK